MTENLSNTRKNNLTKRWRKIRQEILGRGYRLYWHPKYRIDSRFDSDDVCIIRCRPYTHHFKTLMALEEYIESYEAAIVEDES